MKMKLPLSVWFEVDAETKKCRHIIRDANGRKLGDFGSKRTAINQMRRHTAMIKAGTNYSWEDEPDGSLSGYGWLGL